MHVGKTYKARVKVHEVCVCVIQCVSVVRTRAFCSFVTHELLLSYLPLYGVLSHGIITLTFNIQDSGNGDVDGGW